MAKPFCWWCGRNLRIPFFATVKDQLGHLHKVHKICKPDTLAFFRKLTAQEKQPLLPPRKET